MIVCGQCGNRNEDDADFCASCGEPLEWTGEKVEELAPVGESATQPVAADGLQPSAREPAPEVERRAPRPAPQPGPPQPADLFCTSCGAGNSAEANFCRRCGASLADAVPSRLPWWRRLVRRLRPRTRRAIPAGERPGWTAGSHRAAGCDLARRGRRGRRGFRRLTRSAIRVLGLLALVGIVAAGAWRGAVYEHVSNAYSSVRRALFPRLEPVVPTGAIATSRWDGHGARYAIDQNLNTFWAEGVRGDGRGQTLVLIFSQPSSLARIGFTPGDPEAPQSLVRRPTPRELRLVFLDHRRRVMATKVVTLVHSPRFQPFKIDAQHVARVRIKILSVYRAQTTRGTSLAEVEFWSRK
jgi:ribosomal protein L40E